MSIDSIENERMTIQLGRSLREEESSRGRWKTSVSPPSNLVDVDVIVIVIVIVIEKIKRR